MPFAEKPKIESYSGTGVQASVKIDPSMTCSLGINVDGDGDDVDLEVQVAPGGEWYALESGIVSPKVRANLGPINAVRLTINTNNSGAIGFEVAQARM